MECFICFSEILDKEIISCNNCDEKICISCMERFLNILEKEKDVPRCNCKEIFLLNSMKKLNEEKLNKYKLLIYNYLLKQNEDDLSSFDINKKIIKNLQEEKMKFINEKYNGSIKLCIEYAFNDKLKKINKSNRDKFKNSLRRKCFKETCTGKLNKNFICIQCSEQFCEKCERIKKENHSCRQEDLDSIDFINKIIKCPKCKTPILRSYGCNLMTCTNCKSNFNYLNGRSISTGNDHNQNFTLKIHNNLTSALSHEHSSEILKLIHKIDLLKPKEIKNEFNNFVVKYVNDKKDPLLLAKKYEDYVLLLRKNKKYYFYIDEIKKKEKELDVNYLKEIIKKLIKK